MPHQCTNCGRTFADGSKEMLSGCPDCAGTKFQFQPDGFGSDSDGTGSDAKTSGESGTTPGSGSPSSSPPEETAVDSRDRPGDAVSRTVGSAAATVRDLVSGSAGPDATAAKPRSEAAAPDAPDPADTTDPMNASGPAKSRDSADTAGDASDDDIIVAECEPVESEDAAQSDARSQLAEPDEVPENDGFDPSTDDSIDTGVDKITFDDSDEAAADSTTETAAAGGSKAAAESTDEPDESVAESSADDDAEPDDRTAVDEPDTEITDRPDLAELRDELNEQFESIRVLEPGQYELNLMELYDREEYIIALQEDGRYSIQVPETWRQADV